MNESKDVNWSENGYCKDCGGAVEYNHSLNTMSCDTCENETEGCM